jgi:hypothetical protein
LCVLQSLYSYQLKKRTTLKFAFLVFYHGSASAPTLCSLSVFYKYFLTFYRLGNLKFQDFKDPWVSCILNTLFLISGGYTTWN